MNTKHGVKWERERRTEGEFDHVKSWSSRLLQPDKAAAAVVVVVVVVVAGARVTAPPSQSLSLSPLTRSFVHSFVRSLFLFSSLSYIPLSQSIDLFLLLSSLSPSYSSSSPSALVVMIHVCLLLLPPLFFCCLSCRFWQLLFLVTSLTFPSPVRTRICLSHHFSWYPFAGRGKKRTNHLHRSYRCRSQDLGRGRRTSILERSWR